MHARVFERGALETARADYYQNKVRRELAVGTGPAASRIRHLVWGAESEAVALKASESLLAINGLGPKNNQQVSVNVDIKAGWVIDLSDSGRSGRRPQPGDVIIGGEAVELPTPPASDE